MYLLFLKTENNQPVSPVSTVNQTQNEYAAIKEAPVVRTEDKRQVVRTFCRNCGEKFNEGNKFCSGCGSNTN